MGLPVVATDIRGCREVVEHEVTGLLIPVHDPAALAAAIRRLGDDPEMRSRLGARAHEKALRSFDERNIVETVMETYREVARAKGLALFDDQTLMPDAAPCGPGVGYRIAKRLLDLVGATLGLLVLLPIMAMIAALIRSTIGRPVLFTQTRPGRHGRPFRLYKFRTMLPVDENEQEGGSDARRITTPGAFLRRFSLDELPQLVNVLKGDMSLVGPRPLLMRYLELYSREQARRHEVKPGLTGWAQIHAEMPGRGRSGWRWMSGTSTISR